MAVTLPPDNPRDRIEPVADWSQAMGSRPQPARPAVPPPLHDHNHNREHMRSRWRWIVALLALLMAGLVVFRQPIAERLWPDTRVQQLLQQGDAALSEGRLSAADGSGARQRFEAAQALDSDRSEARTGLMRTGQAALVQARAALEADRIADAQRLLELALALQVPRADSDAVDRDLRLRESDLAGVESLLQRAMAAHGQDHLDGDQDAALPLYQKVLTLQPNLTAALEGREDALSDLLQQANRKLDAGQLSEGASLVNRVRAYHPGHVDLPDVQARLTRVIDQKLAAADADLRRGRLREALAGYREIHTVAPEYERARQGLETLSAEYARQAVRKAGDYEFDAAEALLSQAREIAPDSAAVGEAQRELARLRDSRARLPSSLPSAERNRRIDALLVQMRQAETRGQWITPPGDSAYDKLRAAQALSPQHADVKRAAARLVPATRNCFEDELRGNRIARARACYDAWRALEPGGSGLAGARTRLAQKWVAVGTEQLGAGDVAFAVRALEQARALDANAPGMDEFAERVRSAGRVER